MGAHVPRHALTFAASAARFAVKHGLKKGLVKAGAKVNPALLVIEAVISVADAVNSYLKLREARERRDGLQRLIPHEEERLRVERQKLSEELEIAKKEIDQKKRVQRRLGELVLACGRACNTAWSELHAIRESDLPDLDAFEQQQELLEGAWSDVRVALGYFNEVSAETEE